MTSIVYLNGEFLPAQEAKVSVLDRGFLFGDGVYEVIPVYDGVPVGLQQHLERLQFSLDSINLSYNAEIFFFAPIFNLLLKKNAATLGAYSIYIEITRGQEDMRRYTLPKDIKPTVFALLAKVSPIDYAELTLGKSAITLEDTRWKHCHIKSISLLPSLLLANKAQETGCSEAILLRDGYAIEGVSSNLFIVKDGMVMTPHLSSANLRGITRELIIKLAKENSIPLKETNIKEEDLFLADEVWISSSTRGIFPIITINNKPIGKGKVGVIWKKMIRLYLESIEKRRYFEC